MQLTAINRHFNACDQEWDGMPEREAGRFCQQCERVLVDLTDKTEQQVLDLQVQHNFSLCAQYTIDQVHRLDRYLTLQEQPQRSHMPWLVKLAMGLGASGVPFLAAAQEPIPASTIEQTYPKDTTIEVYPGYHTPWVKPEQNDIDTVAGVLKSWKDDQPLAKVKVVIKNGKGAVLAKTTTGLDGAFQLEYKIDGDRDDITLHFKRPGYRPTSQFVVDVRNVVEYSLFDKKEKFVRGKLRSPADIRKHKRLARSKDKH